MLGGGKHPTWRRPTRGRRQDAIAIDVQQRGHGLRVSLGEGGLRLARGYRGLSDPFQASLRELLQVVRAIEGTIIH